jgi:Chemotaxis response regulator containing a CheY-like receiver domain and a methylesterase domain
MFKPSVLIIDDEKAARVRDERRRSYKDNYIVHEARDGADALQMIKTLRPALVLLDINMPQPDGMKTLEM